MAEKQEELATGADPLNTLGLPALEGNSKDARVGGGDLVSAGGMMAAATIKIRTSPRQKRARGRETKGASPGRERSRARCRPPDATGAKRGPDAADGRRRDLRREREGVGAVFGVQGPQTAAPERRAGGHRRNAQRAQRGKVTWGGGRPGREDFGQKFGYYT